MKPSLAAAVISMLFSIPGSTFAGGAVFSKDGSTLYISSIFEKSTLFIVNVATRRADQVDLSGVVGKDTDIGTIARSPEGEVLLEAARTIWRWQPGSGDATKLPPLPEDFVLDEIGCLEQSPDAALKGAVLLTGVAKDGKDFRFYALVPGRDAFQPVFVRRLNFVSAQPAFSTAGRMFFGGDHDLWEGVVGGVEDARAGTLTGCRIAPLALANTDMGNDGSMGVREVAVAGDRVYSLLRGRHLGAIVSVPMPPDGRYQKPDGGHPEVAEAYQLMSAELAKARSVQPTGECDALAAAMSGGQPVVFFRVRGDGIFRWMLVTSHGQPEQIGTERPPK
ncbi:MAG: hypothetical protein NTW21_40305 [Verrucomicrobia bacterium]|nr:hypothetical protein [Verrucomicrobiota bacterium]